MADPVTNNGATSGGGATPNVASAATNGAGPSSTPERQPESRPSWLPEKFKNPEDFAKSYSELEGKLGRTSQYEQQIRDWQQWGDPKTLGQRFQQYLQQQLETDRRSRAAQQQQTPQVDWDAIQDFTGLSPRQYRDAVKAEMRQELGTALNQIIEQRWQQAQNEIASIRNDWDQRQKISNAAMLAKISNQELKDVPIEAIYQKMLEIASGDQNSLLGMAVNQLTAGQQRRTDEAAIEARIRADMELAQKNRNQEGLSGLLRRFDGNQERPRGKDQIKQAILKQGLEKGLFRPENI